MNDEQLKTFIAVKDCGSFSASEQRLYISKQAIMKQINSLEEELGFKLFYRKHNGVSLTKQGEIFYAGAKELLQKKQEILDACIQLEGTPSIRIGNTEHQTLLDPVNIAFSKKYPEIKLKRIVNPNHSGEWRVENNIQDVAETFNIGVYKYKHSIYFPLVTRNYEVIVNPDHPLASHSEISLDDLKKYQVIILPLMMKKEYLDTIRNVFKDTKENLIESSDVDHQVELLYNSIATNTIFISANPFIDSIENIKKIPLKENWNIEYGLLCHTPISNILKKYIEVAREVYSK